MKTSIKNQLFLLLLLGLPAAVQAQSHYQTISINSDEPTIINNQEEVSFVAPYTGTATITYNLTLDPTDNGAEAGVAVISNNITLFSATLINTPEYIYYPLDEFLTSGSPTFGVSAGTTYYLYGSGTIYNSQDLSPIGQGSFSATITYPVSDYLFTINNGTITITGYIGSGGAITIPSAINGLSVASIGSGAFASTKNLTSVTIPNSVTSIGNDAFYNCTNLTSANIPNSVVTIGNLAFDNCFNLSNVTIPNSVTSVGDYAFEDCSSLTSITIPNSVTSINAFPGCSSLTNVTIPNSVVTIGNDTFAACSSLTSITIPNSVTNIGTSAFSNCGLTNVTIPNSVTSIGTFAFSGCPLINVVIPNSVTIISTNAFAYCESLTSIIIPNSVINIEDQAFVQCYSLTSVTIPNSVTSIGSGTFGDCISLTNITIPNSVASIGSYAFFDCFNLTSVYFAGSAPIVDGTVFYGDNFNVLKTYYLLGASGWSLTFWGYSLSGPPAILWNPQAQTSGTSFGVRTNRFGFNITGTSNLVIVVEASTNLANPVWTPVTTNTLTGGSSYFSDPQWTNYTGRFYRLRSP